LTFREYPYNYREGIEGVRRPKLFYQEKGERRMKGPFFIKMSTSMVRRRP